MVGAVTLTLATIGALGPHVPVFARLFAAVFEIPFLRYRGWEALRGALPHRRRGAGRDDAPSRVS